ncbi:Trehalose transport system permease protein SugB [Microbacterium hydrocarbonoxydans]|jgi:raffinose/stachyose/melibiose transport system permease protein|uniref:Trehalose transport system permease protein SugB n=2 Tax=Microbacterium hydrocarbonoxydans TaxID=273678 RepID=A0A0M2HKK3_9MICO|nr:Trehalose transport system permease protein SugB [Microbacterium hydrocarbonoxydans]
MTLTRTITTAGSSRAKIRREDRRPMTARRFLSRYVVGVVAILASIVVFIVPFAFIFLTAAKSSKEASLFEFSLPAQGWFLWENIVTVLETRDWMLVTAFINSTILTVASVAIMVVFSAMVGYVLQRRSSRWNHVINIFVLAGLIVPPAVVPTIWVLQGIGLFKTMPGMILIEATFGLSFCILLFRAFISTIPRELDEAAVIDGAGPIRLFFTVVMPLLKPVAVTVIVVQSVAVFNDFTGPLYFLPGDANATVQLTLYNFQSQSLSQWNLLFMNILLITIPPLVMYIFFNRQIVAGMTSGAVKG